MHNVANNAWSKLAQGITADATSLIVEDASSFPEPPFVVSIDNEIIEVGSKTANTLSGLVRGAEGTAPAAHVSGVRVENRFTAGTYQGVVDEVLTHLDDTENPHAVTAAQIGSETPSGAQAKVNLHAAELVTQAGGVHGLEVETGTFTPILTAATTAPTVSYTIQEGYYVKEGKLVKCNFFLRCTVSGGSGLIEIRNLPFTPTNYREIGMIGEASLGAAKLPYSRLRNSSTLTNLRILKDAKDWAEISEINSGALVDIIATMVYHIE